MESLAKPLRELHEDASWFARATEVKLLHVRCDAALRSSALQVLQAMEAHADNKSPYVLLEDPWKTVDSGWAMRARRLHAHWEERRKVTAEAGIELEALSPWSPPPHASLAAFGRWLRSTVQALRPPLSGLVVVLAPTLIEDASAFETELGELVRAQQLSEVRWVVADIFEASLEQLHDELGRRSIRSECARDGAGLFGDLAALMKSLDPAQPRPMKAAWPRGVLPPRRPTDPVPSEAEQQEVTRVLAEAGVSPALVGPQGQRLEQYLLAAALAMKAGDGTLAIQHQREACRMAHDAGGKRELLLMWMVLAGYELALGREDEAARQYQEVGAQAERDGYPLERAQAGLALALLAARRGRHADAAGEYAAAADAAVAADATGLAIECWRLAGHMASEVALENRAADCWHRAIELAEASEGAVARTSSAPLAARQLATMLRARGLSAQADALEHQANRIEAGETRAAHEAREAVV